MTKHNGKLARAPAAEDVAAFARAAPAITVLPDLTTTVK
jgi:hypothetical protein